MASSSKDLPAAGPGVALTSFTGKSASHKNEKDKDRLENENSDMSFDKRQCLNLTRRTKTGGERKVVVQDSDGCAQHHSPGDSHSSEGSSGWND